MEQLLQALREYTYKLRCSWSLFLKSGEFGAGPLDHWCKHLPVWVGVLGSLLQDAVNWERLIVLPAFAILLNHMYSLCNNFFSHNLYSCLCWVVWGGGRRIRLGNRADPLRRKCRKRSTTPVQLRIREFVVRGLPATAGRCDFVFSYHKSSG